MTKLELGSRLIGSGEQCFVIAEIGINHNGSLSLAKEIVKRSAEAGADAVKFQKRDAPSMMIASKINPDPVGRLSKTADDILEGAPEFGNWSYPDTRLELSEDDYRELKKLADSLNVSFCASPWDDKSTDFLVDLGVKFLKIPSVEIKNPTYLDYIAKTGLPLIMSTGTADIHELDRAVAIIRRHYTGRMCLLQCTSSYPSRFDEIDLRVMQTLRDRYDVPVGYSGHELGIHVSVAAAALGACVIERHVTLNRKMSGPDHNASIEMEEFKEMVSQIRDVEAALGTIEKKHYKSEDVLVSVLGKSVVSKVDIPAGTLLISDLLTTKGPSTGIPASELFNLINRRVRVDIKADSLITMDQIE